MFWRMAGLSMTSPVELLLEKDFFTLEDLLDEDELIQECKSLNSRLINFLRGRDQIQQLLKYIIEEPPEGSDSRRVFKFPFIASEVFTCEIDIIMKTVVEDEELMGLLFSFLGPDRSYGTLLAGYFSKVVICLLIRKTAAVMCYLQAHQDILEKLVNLVGITSIMEVLIRLVGAEETLHTIHGDSQHWLAKTNLLEMLVDKLGSDNSSETQANAADTLSAVSRLLQSELAAKLSSPSFIARLFHHALDARASRSTLVHSLTVCISLLDPKRYAMTAMGKAQQVPNLPVPAINVEIVEGMLQNLGDLLNLLNVEADGTVLHTTYGKLVPPLGMHRLKIIEFLAVLLRSNNDVARQEFVELGAIQQALKIFFDYPFNNFLHRHVENIVSLCLESNDKKLIDHLLVDCDLVTRLLRVFENPYVLSMDSKPTVAAGKVPPKVGNMGHLTRIANQLLRASSINSDVQAHLQGKAEWLQWQVVLQSLNSLEDVSQWTCGRPTTLRDHPVDSDDDDYQERDYDIPNMTSNLTHDGLGYSMHENEDEIFGRDDNDLYFDQDSSGVVMSSLRLQEEHDKFIHADTHSSPQRNTTDADDDDEVICGDDDLVDTASSSSSIFSAQHGIHDATVNEVNGSEMETTPYNFNEGNNKLDNLSFFQDHNVTNDSSLPSLGCQEPSTSEGTRASVLLSDNSSYKDVQVEFVASSMTNEIFTPVVQDEEMNKLVVSEMEGLTKAIAQTSPECIVEDDASVDTTKIDSFGDLPHQTIGKETGDVDFNDVNYWKSNYGHPAAEVEPL